MHTRSTISLYPALVLLVACAPDADEGAEELVVLQGSVQKGPLLLGSSVDVLPLDADGTPTGTFYSTSTSNDAGEFWVEVPKSGPVSIEGSGYYYNEITGDLSGGWITLRAIYMASKNETQPVRINPITHMSYDRVRTLREQGQTFSNAIAIAEQELQVALGIGLADLDISSPGTALDMLGGNTLDNAYLFAVSTVLAQAGVNLAGGLDGSIDAHLQALMNEISVDLADDGQIAAELRASIDAGELGFNTAAVEAALAARLATIGSAAEVPDLDVVLDQDDDLLLNIDDNCDVVANADQLDLDADGTGEVCDNCPGLANPDQADLDHDGVGDLCDLECGDGQLDADETCDDGNLIDGDGCNADCVPSGQFLWQVQFDSDSETHLQPTALSVAPEGTVVVSGASTSSDTPWLYNGFLRRYDGDGQQLLHYWQPSYIYDVLAESDGFTLFVDEEGLVRIDEQGQVVLSVPVPSARELDRNGDGPIIVSTSEGLVAIDDFGDELWSVDVPGLPYIAYMAVAADDTVFRAALQDDYEWPVVFYRYDANGNQLPWQWSSEYGLVNFAVRPTGELALVREDPFNEFQLSVLAGDGSTMLWTVALDGFNENPIYGLDVDALGRIAYVWSDHNPNEYDQDPLNYVTKLDADGIEIWTASIDQGSWETPQRVAFGPDGSVHTLTIGGEFGTSWLHKFTP